MSLVLQIVGWFVAMVVLMSIIEHQVHSRLMHKMPRYLPFRNLKGRKRMFTSHAVEHHRQYRQHFHDEPVPRGEDRGIRLNIVEGLVECLPVPLVLVGISYATGMTFPLIGAAIFPMVVALHHLIWNQVHLEMHKPENRFFSQWAIYKFMARHHFLHHRHPDKNFNVAFPIGDWIFGTVAKADDNDEQTMQQDRIAA
ncbi:MAG: hypothetical protein ACKO40_00720 [Planctomycetaceae bacterium]